jgi:hypothetical protein
MAGDVWVGSNLCLDFTMLRPRAQGFVIAARRRSPSGDCALRAGRMAATRDAQRWLKHVSRNSAVCLIVRAAGLSYPVPHHFLGKLNNILVSVIFNVQKVYFEWLFLRAAI